MTCDDWLAGLGRTCDRPAVARRRYEAGLPGYEITIQTEEVSE